MKLVQHLKPVKKTLKIGSRRVSRSELRIDFSSDIPVSMVTLRLAQLLLAWTTDNLSSLTSKPCTAYNQPETKPNPKVFEIFWMKGEKQV